MTVVTDSRYVADGITAVQAGRGVKYLQGLDGDCWKRVAAARVVDVLWIPSHKSREEILALGYDLEDWLGNREADRLAGAVTAVRGPAPALVDLQRSRLRLARAAAGVIGAVHQAALAHDSVPGGFFHVMKRKPPPAPNRKGRLCGQEGMEEAGAVWAGSA